MPPLVEAAPPLPELLVPPLPLVPASGPELELDEEPGELGVVLEDDDEPPGTMTVSFSFVTVVVELGAELPLGGITVVVSFFSHPDTAKAPNKINT